MLCGSFLEPRKAGSAARETSMTAQLSFCPSVVANSIEMSGADRPPFWRQGLIILRLIQLITAMNSGLGDTRYARHTQGRY